MITIYKLTDIATKKIYVGSTCNLQRRINEHKTHRKSVCRMYGFTKFDVDILEEVSDKSTAVVKERDWCNIFLSLGENVICKIKGNQMTPKLRGDYSLKRSDEFYSGKSTERVLRMSKVTSIKVIDQHGTVYNSFNECARQIKSHPSDVMNVVNGKSKHTKGYVLRRFI